MGKGYLRLFTGLLLLCLALGLAGTLSQTDHESQPINKSPTPQISSSSYPQIIMPQATTSGPFSFIVIILMENENYADIIGNSFAPYLNVLADNYGYAQNNYHEVSRNGSLSNYLGITAANTFGSWSHCNSAPHSCTPSSISTGWPAGGVTDQTIVDEIEAAGLTWKAYMEDMPSNCYQYNSPPYMATHDPFAYYSRIINNSTECAKVVPAGTGDSNLLNDLNGPNPPNYMWLTPNACNDMHGLSVCTNGCTTTGGTPTCVADGDSYLSNLIPEILNSTLFQNQRAAIFLTWDEPRTSGTMPAIWAGPVVNYNYTSTTVYNHYSLLKTIEAAWNLQPLTANDANPVLADMTAFFTNLHASFTHSPNNPLVGQQVTFTATASGGISPYTYKWDFGDGGIATGRIASHSYAATGAFTVTLSIADASKHTVTTSTVLNISDFAVTSNPSVISTLATASAPATITVTPLNGFIGNVTLSDTPLPNGLTCNNISPSTITSSGNATITCSSTVAGNYTVTIAGTSSLLLHSTTALFQVYDFVINTTSPTAIDATQSATSTISITGLNHFMGNVTLSDTPPSGLTCAAIVPGNVSGSGTASVSCSSLVAGNYTLTIIGRNGPLIHNATAIFRFQDFSITAPTPLMTNVNVPVVANFTITGLNRFGGTVTITDNVPSGLNCGPISPNRINGAGTGTISCYAAAPGNYTLTISGTSGPLSHSIMIVVTVPTGTVGGVVLPVDKLKLAAPFLSAMILMLVILAAGIFSIRKRSGKRRAAIYIPTL